MRLYNITDIAAAKDYLASEFLARINTKYANSTRRGDDAHRPILYEELKKLIYRGYERQVQNDWVVPLNNFYYPLEKSRPLQVCVKQKVEIRRHVDGTVSIWRKDRPIKFIQLKQKLQRKKEQPLKTGNTTARRSAQSTKNRRRTPWDEDDWLWRKKRKKSLDKRRRGHFRLGLTPTWNPVAI